MQSKSVVEITTKPGMYSEIRSHIMRSVNRTNTSPEMLVRKFLHKQGLRFRLHNKDLPGTPDIVLPRHKTVVFVHGCFWHRHTGCSKATTPKTRLEFWNNKFTKNVKRDGENERILRQLGWQVLVVWECATKSEDDLVKALNPLFENDKKYGWTEAGQGK